MRGLQPWILARVEEVEAGAIGSDKQRGPTRVAAAAGDIGEEEGMRVPQWQRRARLRRMLRRLEWQRKQGVSAIEGGSCGCKRRWQWLFCSDEEEDIKATAEKGLAAVEVARKRRRRQRGLTRVAVAGEQRGPARKRLGSAEGRRNDTARSVGREEVAAVGKSGRQ
ncbi:hypothetical protein B296_00009400 [Ensete ventricosum]|uniref:Uncharacterized protein n=1 Tax=Ensete ventricosum TaxID=4639 RepID=A0A426Y7C1_ENSVE|nr:hypothetical protein B296_00009400 [Ensete ventricosum]